MQQGQILAKQMVKTAVSPITTCFSQMLIMWFVGGNVSPMALMMFANLLGIVLANASNVNKAFAKYSKVDKSQVNMFKLLYLICCFVPLSVAFYKFSKLGIFPTHDADFIPTLEKRKPLQEMIN